MLLEGRPRWDGGPPHSNSRYPTGRPKGLTDPLNAFLTRKVPGHTEGRRYLEKLVESMVERAIAKIDVLVKEIFDRVEGKVPNDLPGAPGEFNQFIDVVPPKHHHNNGNPPAKKLENDNGNKPEKVDPRLKD